MDLRNNKQTQAEGERHSDPFISGADPVGKKKLFIK